jgi:epsin
MDEERLRTERADRKTWKSRVTGLDDFHGPDPDTAESPQRRRPERRTQQRTDDEDLEYKLALEASKNAAEEDKKRRESKDVSQLDDDDLAKAIRLSKEEEELRRRELEDSNANSLFDDTPTPTQPQYTGYNQGYHQQEAVDWFGNPVDRQAQQQQQQQQSQTTGYLNNAYSQGSFQSQPTGFQNGFQQQQTGFDPSQLQQPSYLQPQQTSFNISNPYTQTTDLGIQLPQQQSPTAGSHNPWAVNQQSQLDVLKPAPTGSNNPFASTFSRPQPQQQKTSPPVLNTLVEQRTAVPFNSQPSFNPLASYSTPQTTPAKKQELDPQRARLNALLASGEGMDTFGNTGDLRIPAQHTAPGNFVSNSGQGLSKLHTAQTGNNPFFSQQFTGTPQQALQAGGFGAQPQNRFAPAQSGSVGASGFGASPFSQGGTNPFGGQHHQQQGQGGGSLIDLA